MKKILLGILWFGGAISDLNDLAFMDRRAGEIQKLNSHAFIPFSAEITFPEEKNEGRFSGEGYDMFGRFSLEGIMDAEEMVFFKTYDQKQSENGARFPVRYDLQNEGGGWHGVFRYNPKEHADPQRSIGHASLTSYNIKNAKPTDSYAACRRLERLMSPGFRIDPHRVKY